MFRHERPQKGRTRQFHQIGAEVFGAEGPDVDAELIAMAERLWQRLGINGLTLHLNSLGSAEERITYRESLVGFLHQHRQDLDEATRERAQRNPLRVLDSKDAAVQALLEDAPRLGDFLGTQSQAHFDSLRLMLDRLGIEYQVNQKLVRGLDYYSHTVFEWITDQLGSQGTVCAGGRYDNLVELQGGKPWPGIGFAMGQERLVELIGQGDEIAQMHPHIYMVLAGEEAKLAGMSLAERLRDELDGIRIVCNPGDGSFKSQFKRADRSGASMALVMGENELQTGTVSIKPLRGEEPQHSVDVENLVEWLGKWIKQIRHDAA